MIIPAAIILSLSLAILGSISLDLLYSQLIFLFFGLIAGGISFWFYYANHLVLTKLYYLIALGLLLLPFIFGVVTRGSIRWIQIGNFTIQPSELIKPLLIIIFAGFLSTRHSWLKPIQFLVYGLLVLLPAGLIYFQPDLGSTLVVLAIWLGMLFASDWPLLYPLGLFIAGAAFAPFGIKFLQPYQQQRLLTFINPYQQAGSSGYQVIQSLVAVGSGGLFGRGLGQGVQSQLQFLPERHTDFIFAALAEELGFAGSCVLILAYFWLLKKILTIAGEAPDKFSYLIVMGCFFMFSFQVIVNLGMNVGVLPVTGITLPLASGGGSSLLSVMFCLGLIYNISSHHRVKTSLAIK